MRADPDCGLVLEQLRAVFPGRVEPVPPLAHPEQEIELRPTLLVHELDGRDAVRLELRSLVLPVWIVQRHHHLEDGRLAHVPFGRGCTHDRLVGDVGVRECA